MANLRSAKKRIRTTEKKTAHNRNRKSKIKTYINSFHSAIEAGDVEKAGELLKVIDRDLKRAEVRNIVHKNASARTLSRLTKKLNAAM